MKSLDEMIAVMEASKTKEIEYMALVGAALNYPEWRPFNPLVMRFNWADFDYRVKVQEPRRVWIAHYDKKLFVLDVPDSTLSNAAEYVEMTKEIREKLGL